jgi:hypothetical protein
VSGREAAAGGRGGGGGRAAGPAGSHASCARPAPAAAAVAPRRALPAHPPPPASILDDGSRLELLHKTQLEGIPGALAPFKGRLLAGVGPVLRLFDLGRKKLLRKCEYRQLPHHVVQLHSMGSRVYAGDVQVRCGGAGCACLRRLADGGWRARGRPSGCPAGAPRLRACAGPTHSLHPPSPLPSPPHPQESVHFLRYNKRDNSFYIFADDFTPRYVTTMLPLDYDTLAVADKFGNVAVLRLPADVSQQARVLCRGGLGGGGGGGGWWWGGRQGVLPNLFDPQTPPPTSTPPRTPHPQVEDDPTGGKNAAALGRLNGAPNKLEPIAQFHVGDTVTSLQRAALQPGGSESLLYGTIMGGVGALYPFASKEVRGRARARRAGTSRALGRRVVMRTGWLRAGLNPSPSQGARCPCGPLTDPTPTPHPLHPPTPTQDMDFFLHLEMHLRQEHPPLSGRDHMAFRSAYFPVRSVVDGDLCSQFPAMPAAKQKAVAEELERAPGEVLKKLEDMRNKIL